MYRRVLRSLALSGMLLGLAATCHLGRAAAAKEGPLPRFDQVEKTVERYFAAKRDYRPGDILTRSDVEPLFGQLQRLGWTVADRKEILGQVPTDGEFLVRQLRSRRGREFMRQIGPHPDTYDRLQRLSRMPHGKRTVSRLIQQPGKGSDVIKYLAGNPDGIRASKQMSKKVTGKNFHKPTGRIYTEKMLLERLRQSHKAAQQRAAAQQSAAPPRRPK